MYADHDPIVLAHARTMLDSTGLELIPPGVVRIPEWRPGSPADVATPATMWGGVGRKAF